MHWCHGETQLLLASFPFLVLFWSWLKAKLHHSSHHKDCSQPDHFRIDSKDQTR